MKKLSKKTLWIIVTVLFLLAILLIVLCSIASGIWPKVLMVLLGIDFILLTILIQRAAFISFRYKPKYNYVTKDYKGDFSLLETNLKNNKFKPRNEVYGKSFLLVLGTVAYKCNIVLNYEKYFNQPINDESNSTPNKDLEKCDRFIGIEIFKEIDEANLAKLPDFSLQGKNIYYTALLYQDNDLFKCLNYVEPNEDFNDAFNNLFEFLGLTEYNNEDIIALENND